MAHNHSRNFGLPHPLELEAIAAERRAAYHERRETALIVGIALCGIFLIILAVVAS